MVDASEVAAERLLVAVDLPAHPAGDARRLHVRAVVVPLGTRDRAEHLAAGQALPAAVL